MHNTGKEAEMKLIQPYNVKCEQCGTVIDLDIDMECMSSYERNMGPELEYLGTFDGTCPECGSDITVQIEAWEYPEGALEGYNVSKQGVDTIDSPQFNMMDGDD
jgi:hypothetical protein